MTAKKELISNLQVGSDVEYGLQNIATGEIVSAEGIIQGTKHEPFHFDPENNYYATSLDNVLAEGNIPPVTNALDLYLALEKLRKYIDNHVGQQGLKTIAVPNIRLDQKWLQTENARTLGCAPSLNSWSQEYVYPELKGENDTNRAIGYHLHAGYDNPNEETNFMLIQACDLFLGIPSILLEPANERKSTGYGLAGSMRHTRFGAEYRTLSSYFSSSKELIEWSFNNFVNAANFVNNERSIEIAHRGNEIQSIINSEDKKGAEKLIKEFNLELI